MGPQARYDGNDKNRNRFGNAETLRDIIFRNSPSRSDTRDSTTVAKSVVSIAVTPNFTNLKSCGAPHFDGEGRIPRSCPKRKARSRTLFTCSSPRLLVPPMMRQSRSFLSSYGWATPFDLFKQWDSHPL